MEKSAAPDLKERFCRYRPTEKLFDELSFPPVFWEVFEKMKNYPMTVFQISHLLCVNQSVIIPIIANLLKEEALEKDVEDLCYVEWIEASRENNSSQDNAPSSFAELAPSSAPIETNIQSDASNNSVVSIVLD